QRNYVAAEYLSQARRYIDAEEALISIRAAGGGNTDQVQRLRSYVHFRAVLQSIINIVNKAPYMDGIIFCGMLSPDALKTIIEEMKVNFNYFIKYIGEMDSIENKETYFIITGDDVDSNQLVNMGFNGNQIINETELMQIF
ncbi:MAG: hypothetical protein OEW37_04980, partial [Rhodospirillaceae bacterium]|nr:hypothetical protein [Rhodospirillaceae bacterium]